MKIATLQWAVAMFCALVGAMMLIVPHQFETPAHAIVKAHLAWWGCLYLLAGAALCAVVIGAAPRWAVIAAHATAGAALLLFASAYALTSRWTATASWGVLALGTLAAPALPRVSDRGRSDERPDTDRHLLPLMMGVASLANGLILVLVPGRFWAPAHSIVQPYAVSCGIAFIVGGLSLCAVQARPAVTRNLVLAAHLLAGAVFLAYFVVLAVRAHIMPAMVYYGGFGAVIAAYPWLSRAVTPVRLESLQTRLALVLVAAVALPLLLTVVVLSERSEHASVQQELPIQQALTRSVARDLADYIGLHRAVVGALAAYPGLTRMTPDQQRGLLREFAVRCPDAVMFGTFDAAGRSIARSDDRSGPAALASVPGLAGGDQRGGISLGVSPLTHEPVLWLGEPITGPGGQVAGIAVVAIPSAKLAVRLERTNRALGGGETYVVDGRGRLIAQGDQSSAAPFADFAGAPPVAALLARPDASGALRFRSRGGDTLAAYARIPGMDWGVVVEQPARVVLGVTRAGRETAFALLLLAVGIAVAGGVAAAGGIVRPILALAREVDRIGEAHAPLALPRSSVVEVTHLADRFGEMHARLVARTQEWERAHAALRASEERTRRILESASDAFVEMDAAGVITAWNAQAERIFGWRRDEAVGRRLRELIVPPALWDEHDRRLRRYLATGEPNLLSSHSDITALHRDGHGFPVELTVSAVREGETLAFSAFIRDITARKLAEEALNQHARELARSNAELQAFAYVASHDLQEPLRMVTSYVQLLAKRYGKRLDAEAQEFIGYALDGATRMHELIDDLLAYSRVGTRGKELLPTQCEGALRSAVANLKVAIEESGGDVIHDPLPAVMGDESQLVQLFQNLIGNAVKFRGAAPLRVHIWARRVDREWEFSVADNGIGISPEYRERIFVIFQRLHSRAEHPGTGIGLAICKKIVERHGGRIWVTSTPDGGATFHFTLPAAEVLAHA